jgi:hypothetical protein
MRAEVAGQLKSRKRKLARAMEHKIARESYAIMVQNYQWFVHHFLGEELDLFMDDTDGTI